MANASDCGSEDRGFESHHSPHTKELPSPVPQAGEGTTQFARFQPVCRILGCRQVVRHQTLTLAFVGSSPAIPATSSEWTPHGSETSKVSGSRRFFGCAPSFLLFPIEARFDGAPGEKAAPFRFRGFRKSRENSISAASFLLFPTGPASLGSGGGK